MTPPTAALPCPFCGGAASEISISAVRCSTVGCLLAGLIIPLKAWDTRAPAVHATADADEAIKATGEAVYQYVLNNWNNGNLTAEAFAAIIRKAVSPKAAAEIPVAELLTLRAELVQYASDAYCTGLRIAQTTPCLGWEAKAKCGEYGKAEHEAHRDSDNWDGKHRGAWECIRRLDAVLDSPAAVSGDKQEKERG